tara:strand:- start:1866 stop:2228 length:363 start_codon:yes stop_codon:yes gene_type:complete
MNKNPINVNQIKLIDQLNLSMIEKHHLRLLIHCLQSFKEMPNKESLKKLPSQKEQLEWCISHPKLSQDKEFIQTLLSQFASAGTYLEEIANSLKIPPMELTFQDLINDAMTRADTSSNSN